MTYMDDRRRQALAEAVELRREARGEIARVPFSEARARATAAQATETEWT